MSGRIQKDSFVSFGKRNVPKVKWETAKADNLPGRIYPYVPGKYIAREELATGMSIVSIWDAYSENSSSYQDQLKFLIAKKDDLCWKQAEPGKPLPTRAVHVDTSTLPNIYVGRNDKLEIGTVIKNADTGFYEFFVFSKSTMEKQTVETENYEVLCTV